MCEYIALTLKLWPIICKACKPVRDKQMIYNILPPANDYSQYGCLKLMNGSKHLVWIPVRGTIFTHTHVCNMFAMRPQAFNVQPSDRDIQKMKVRQAGRQVYASNINVGHLGWVRNFKEVRVGRETSQRKSDEGEGVMRRAGNTSVFFHFLARSLLVTIPCNHAAH